MSSGTSRTIVTLSAIAAASILVGGALAPSSDARDLDRVEGPRSRPVPPSPPPANATEIDVLRYEREKREHAEAVVDFARSAYRWAERNRLPGPVCELRQAPTGRRVGGTSVPLPDELQQAFADPPAAPLAATSCATFNVTYNGFTPAAQTAFQYAVDIWSRLIDSPVTINVTANWTPLGPGILGSAGPQFIWRNFGSGVANTWYADALADKLNGADVGGGGADINANFSSTANWYLGTDGQAGPGQTDFVTVVLHELGHGLGFFGLGDGSAAMGTVRSMGDPSIYDRFVENGGGTSILTFVDPSNALGNQLRGGDLFHDSPSSTAANGGARPEIFAPGTWNGGSSYSHWDEATFPPGDVQSLMTPFLGGQEAIHQPGPITLGAFADHGWAPFCPTQTPVNDLCVDALPLPSCGSVTGSTLGSSFTGTPPGFCGTAVTAPGVWYELIGTGGPITLSTCGGTTNYDTKITVYSGSCGSEGCVAGNDDDFSCPASVFHSSVTFASNAGETYLVYVHGFGSGTGDFTLTVDSDTDGDGLCDPIDPDDDNDGVADGPDPAPFDPDVCGDSDADLCDDCAVGTDDFGPLSDQLPNNDGLDTDSDGACNVGDPDDDNDGVADGPDPAPLDPDVCGDSDADLCDDCTVGTDDFGPLSDQLPNNDGLDTDSDGACNVGDPDDDNDGVEDGPDPAPLDPFVCGLDNDGDTCDDCTGGGDVFGPLPNDDITDDGPDDDADGICNDGDQLFFSTVSTQFVAGFGNVFRANVYNAPPVGALVDLVGTFLPSTMNLDALDVMASGDVLFSVNVNGVVNNDGANITLNHNNVYRLSGGVITTELDMNALGLGQLGTLNAIDRLWDGSYALSTSASHWVAHGGGTSYVRPWQVWRLVPGTSTLNLVADLGALYGFTDVDGVDRLKDGRIGFSISTNKFLPGVGWVRNQDAMLYDPIGGTLIVSYPGVDVGISSEDGLTLILPE